MNTLPDSPVTSAPDGYRTPPRAVSTGSPPNAPLRLRRADSLVEPHDDTDTSPDSTCNCHGNSLGRMPVPRVLIPSIDYHKGKGILAGDFIKPDPSATINERHTHILTELHRWLSGRIQVHARDVWGQDDYVDMVNDGMWPAARLHMIVQARTTATDDRTAPETLEPRVPARRASLRWTSELVYHETAMWAVSICMQYLIDGIEAENSVVDMAIGFVRDDRLPDGRTIAELWDTPSVFEPLRTAAPLSLDDRIDAAIGVWDKPMAVELPVWGWVAVTVLVVIYAWIVAYLVGNPTLR